MTGTLGSKFSELFVAKLVNGSLLTAFRASISKNLQPNFLTQIFAEVPQTKNGLRYFLINSLLLFVSAVGLAANTVVLAQDSDAFVAQVLQQAERQSGFTEVFTKDGRFLLARLDDTLDYRVIRRQGDWLHVRFAQARVPLWVSQDFIVRQGTDVEVTARRLNMRLEPSLDAPVAAQAVRGYQSSILSERDNFVQIYAPTDIEFAVRASQDQSLPSSSAQNTKSKWQTPKTAAEATESPKSVESSDVDQKPTRSDAITSFQSQRDQQVDRQHRLSPGDAISLRVFGEDDLSVDNVRIPSSGSVSFPLIGSVDVAGKTTIEVENRVAQLLAQGYVRDPRLSVSIFSYRPIFIRGAVVNVGSYPYTEGLTVGNAIAIAGGAKKSAVANGVTITRDGQQVASGIDLNSDRRLRAGDVISLEAQEGVSEETASYVYLHGEVANPGEYEFRRGLTVEKAVVLAGGFTIRASRGRVTITRYTELQDSEKPKKLKRVKLYTPIEPGDIINVGASLF